MQCIKTAMKIPQLMLCLTVHYFCSMLGIYYLTMSILEMATVYFVSPSKPFLKNQNSFAVALKLKNKCPMLHAFQTK